MVCTKICILNRNLLLFGRRAVKKRVIIFFFFNNILINNQIVRTFKNTITISLFFRFRVGGAIGYHGRMVGQYEQFRKLFRVISNDKPFGSFHIFHMFLYVQNTLRIQRLPVVRQCARFKRKRQYVVYLHFSDRLASYLMSRYVHEKKSTVLKVRKVMKQVFIFRS